MKKRSLIMITVVGMFLILSGLGFVSAGIYFSDMNSQYNLGDVVEVSANVDPILEGRLLKLELICQGESVISFNSLPDESGNVVVKLPLNQYSIEDISGTCNFFASYAGETRGGPEFEISRRLDVHLSSDSYFTKPGEEITITGSAERLNGALVNGEVEIDLPLLSYLTIGETVDEIIEEANSEEVVEETNEIDEIIEEANVGTEEVVEEVIESDFTAGKYYGKVVDGQFSVTFKLAKDTPSGDYRIDILVYEEAFGERASEGTAFSNLEVFQILSDIELVLNDLNFDPGSNLEFKANLLDQSGMQIADKVSVIIKDINSERIFEKIVDSQETITYKIPGNLSSGYYNIELSSGEISNNKDVFINEKAIAQFELINDTLTVTNVGNMIYNKNIEIELNGKPFIKKVYLDMGESKNFKLTGSEGSYDVKVTDGESEISVNGVMLTGSAIGVFDSDGKFSLSFGPLIWIFIIIILIVILLFFIRKVLKKKSTAIHSDKKMKKVKSIDNIKDDDEVRQASEKQISKGNKLGDTKSSHSQANQVLVLKGHKTPAVALVLKIKNKIGQVEKNSLEKAIEHAYQRKGAVYEQGDYIFIMFSPLMTHNNKNEVEAVKAAEKISDVLKEHNKRFRDKIDFGIGINNGEIINKIEDKKLKFTALGNFIVVAKRLAESSDKQLLITRNVFEKGGVEIKGEKKLISSGEVYEVRRVIDREKNQKFIKGFIDRMEKEKKS
ncbi:MAG: hypothetical protein ABIH37_03755 [archaeon]